VEDLVEEVVGVAGRDLRILRPRDSETLLTEEAFEREELLPYWAELWPSARALAREVANHALKRARTVDLGCGLGLASLAAAAAGGRVLATDWSPEATRMAARNAERNGLEIETAIVDWNDPQELLQRAPFDLVLASDVLYERRNGEVLLALLPQLGDEVWLADPGRPAAADFFAAAEAHFSVTMLRAPEIPQGGIYRLRA
jgi:predicted nicotinamide N-methyase